MKTKTLCYFTFVVCIVVFCACGESDDNVVNPPVKPTTPTETADDEIEVEEVVIDFAAEEDSIRQLFLSHAAALSVGDVQEVMEHWMERNTPDVFMVECFTGIVTRIEKWSNIKKSWDGNFAIVGRGAVLTVTIDTVGIEEKGKKATLRANWKWSWLSGQMVAAIEKDKQDN